MKLSQSVATSLATCVKLFVYHPSASRIRNRWTTSRLPLHPGP